MYQCTGLFSTTGSKSNATGDEHRVPLSCIISSKFAGDSKIGRIIRLESDIKDLQGDLNRLNESVVRW